MESTFLSKVPQDILLMIADRLPAPDLNSLSQTCRVLGGILSPILYRLGAREAVTVNGLQPICWASKEGLLNTVKQLLAQGARTEGLRNTCGRCRRLHRNTALHWAAQSGHAELVKFYLDIGMDVNAVDDYNASPLHWISKGEGSPEAAQVLLDHGAHTEIQDCGGDTAIGWALAKRHIPLVRLLVDSGADLKTLDFNYCTLLEGIFRNLCTVDTSPDIISTLVKILLDGGFDISTYYVDAEDSKYMSLYFAVLRNDVSSIERMLDAGLDVNSVGYMRATALYISAVHGHKEVASLLLSRGANPELSTLNDERPLDVAIRGGHSEVVKLLLDAGADCRYRTTINSLTPLQHAAMLSTSGYSFERKEVDVEAQDEI
jgi:ankyrin repeat protein